MSELTSAAPPAAQPTALRPRNRRGFLAGMGLIAGGLAVAARFAPDWSAGAPARASFAAAAPVAAPPAPVQYSAADRAEWRAFRSRYVTPDGRVVDTGNGNVSHSEGQGWGLMGAQAGDDPDSFTRILDWTTRTLQRRPYDCLHAWRYRPNDANPVADLNNATDGDLFIAAALARAAVRWGRPDYAAAAGRLAEAILGLVRHAGPRTLLLPGAVGFEAVDAFTVNPSYYAFALFPDLAALAPSGDWALLRQDGLALASQGRFGRWSLPPDWLRVARHDGALSIAPGWPPRFSYDAIRVPMHLVWARLPARPVLEAFDQYWAAPRPMPPAWVDLATAAVAAYAAPAGIRAVAALVGNSIKGATVALPSVSVATDYYSAGLVLLSRLASREGSANT